MANCSSNSLLDDINKAKADMKAKLAEGTSAIKSGIGALANSVKSKLSGLVPSAPANSSFKDDLSSLFGKTGAALEQAKYDLNQKWGSMVSDISKFTDAINPFGESSLNLCADVPNVEGSPNPDGSLTKVTKAQDSPAPAVAPEKPAVLTPTIVDATSAPSSGINLDGQSAAAINTEWELKINKPIKDILSNRSKSTSLAYSQKTYDDKLATIFSSKTGRSVRLKCRGEYDIEMVDNPWDPSYKLKNPTAAELEWYNSAENKKTYVMAKTIPIWRDYMGSLFGGFSTWAKIKAPYELDLTQPFKSNSAYNAERLAYHLTKLRNATKSGDDRDIKIINDLWDNTIKKDYFDKCTAIVEANLSVAEKYNRLHTQVAK
jgi:hypothetical protein